jgi:DNA-binding Lrp family transcriptional regulator
LVLDEIDSKILFEANKQAPFVTEPFKEIAARLGLGPSEVISRLTRLQKDGAIRRFGAKIKPIDIGLIANAMVAWKVPDHRVQEVGSFLSKLTEVTHCYERETVLGKWEYNLYTVMHSQNRESIETAVRKLSRTLGVGEYLILFSKKNLKIRPGSGGVEYQNFPEKRLSK